MKEEQRIEQEILAKGLTAPRVTPADLDAVIVREDYHRLPGTNITVCVLTLKNGLTATGVNHGSVDPRNYSEAMGKEMSYKAARDTLWPMLGYELANKLSLVRQAQPLLVDDPLFRLGSPTTYVGEKVIYALPMTRQEYNDFRGWQLPADENGSDAGFLVQYADGGTTNVEGFSGYLSWSPAEVFNRAYRPFGSAQPQPVPTFLDRLMKERLDLQEKCEKLAQFLTTEAFASLADLDRGLLHDQYEHMTSYMSVLTTRLGRLSQGRLAK